VVLNFVMMALYGCLMAQAWNCLGGYGGQFSFGHALFFGTGAYVQAIAQLQGGLNPWARAAAGELAAALVGLLVGALSFRYGLQGSYFALVTLAFAEVFRILSPVGAVHRRGVGLMVPLSEARATCSSATAAAIVWLACSLVVCGLLLTFWLRHSRFGAWLQAVRDNEDAARAIGVDPFRVKLGAIVLSGALMARPAPSTCRSSSTSTQASPTGRTPRWKPWLPPSWAGSARCGGRCWARWCCTCSATSPAACSGRCPASTW
jgi:branched-chain amino acid transport system permease protein